MSDWQERAAEAVDLAPRAEEAAVASRLLTLLLDPDNTAVSQAAAEALLNRGDLVAVGLLATAFAAANEDTRNKLGDCLYDEEGDRWARVRSLLDDLPDVGGALRDHMATEERGHR